MPCYRPLVAYQCSDGAVVFSETRKNDITRQLLLPCGQCVGCRLERSRQWAIRCVHEASLYERNAFITLTYRPEEVDPNGSLRYRDFQLFIKRLRKAASKEWITNHPNDKQPTTLSADMGLRPIPLKNKLRFYMCGEYGEENHRPHFHACIFNYDFHDKKLWKTTKDKNKIYTSETLDQLWGKGFTSIAEVNFETAAYIARYVMKKITGKKSKKHYEHIDADTGEITQRTPEFNKMSLKPGIGKGWLEKWETDVFPEGEVEMRGHKMRPPKYYDRLYAKSNPEEWETLAWIREQRMQLHKENNTPQRLATREKVKLAAIRTLRRTID